MDLDWKDTEGEPQQTTLKLNRKIAFDSQEDDSEGSGQVIDDDEDWEGTWKNVLHLPADIDGSGDDGGTYCF